METKCQLHEYPICKYLSSYMSIPFVNICPGAGPLRKPRSKTHSFTKGELRMVLNYSSVSPHIGLPRAMEYLAVAKH